MKLQRGWLALALVGVLAGAGFAQQPGSTVQLPTFSFFSGSTTVSVPDRGSAYLGGVKRAASGRNEFGTPLLPFRPFRNSAIGTQRSASNMHVTATIHDFEAMDRFLLSQPSTTRSGQSLPPRPAAALGHTLQPRRPPRGASWDLSLPDAAGPSSLSVAEVRAKRVRQQQTRTQEAKTFFQRGRNAEAAGKANVARIYYQMAARRASGELEGQVAERLEAIRRIESASRLAQGKP